MMAFGMVVIAGIVGSGGVGETIYGAIRKLDIALSVNAAIAIVILKGSRINLIGHRSAPPLRHHILPCVTASINRRKAQQQGQIAA